MATPDYCAIVSTQLALKIGEMSFNNGHQLQLVKATII